MELTVAERLMLGALLGPIAADVATLRVVRDLQGELGFSDEESEALNFHPGMEKNADGEEVPDGRLLWNGRVPQAKEFEFGPTAMRIIQGQLRKASASKALTLQQLDLYDKFCPEEVEEYASVR